MRGEVMGPNNYGHRQKELVAYIKKNPNLKRNEILNRLGFGYLYSFNEIKRKGVIVPSKGSTYKDKHWIVKGGAK